MKKILFIGFILINVQLFSQKKGILSNNELNSDLEYFKNVIYNCHPAPFSYISKDSIDKVFLLFKFQEDTSVLVLEKRIEIILSKIGCAHTELKNSSFEHNKFILPFEFYVNPQGVFIKNTLTDSLDYLKGFKVGSINGNSAETIINVMKNFKASDGYNETLKYQLLSYKDNLSVLYNYYFDQDSIKTLNLLNDKEDTIIKNIQTIKYSSKKEKDRDKNGKKICKYNYLKIDTLNQLALLNIRSFGISRIRVVNSYKKLFRTLNDLKIKYFILDLRDNTGGNVLSSELLLSYLLDTSYNNCMIRKKTDLFKHSTKISKFYYVLEYMARPMIFIKNKEVTDSSIIRKRTINNRIKNNYKNELFVITNGFTASGASYFSSVLKNKQQATIIGQETGGGAASLNGAFYSTVKLPNSRLKISIPVYHIDFDLIEDKGHGVIPDYKIEYNINDIINGIDLEYNKIIEIIENNAPTHNSGS